MNEVRKYSNKLIELVETGVLDPVDAVRICVKWMSEDDVQSMMEANEIEYDYEEEDEVPSSPYIINVGDTLDTLYPTVAYINEVSAIAAAKQKAETGYKYVEVVYMPEDDDDINEVVWKNWR